MLLVWTRYIRATYATMKRKHDDDGAERRAIDVRAQSTWFVDAKDQALYKKNGFVVVENVLSKEELDVLREESQLLYKHVMTDVDDAHAAIVEQVRT